MAKSNNNPTHVYQGQIYKAKDSDVRYLVYNVDWGHSDDVLYHVDCINLSTFYLARVGHAQWQEWIEQGVISYWEMPSRIDKRIGIIETEKNSSVLK